MLTLEEERSLVESLPIEKEGLVSPDLIAQSILVLEEREKIFIREEKLLEEKSLSYEAIKNYFYLQELITTSGISEASLKKLSLLASTQINSVTSLDLMNQASMLIFKQHSKICPQCKQPMNLRNVPEPRGRLNIYGWKSSWFCDCGYEEFSTEPYTDIVNKLVQETAKEREQVVRRIKDELITNRIIANNLVCPECGSILSVYKLNIPKGRRNLFGWKSVKRCGSCTYEEYSKEEFILVEED